MAGKNWKVFTEDTVFWLGEEESGETSIEDLRIQPGESFSEEDYVVYSGIIVGDSGRVQPMLLIKRVGDLDYGGDYLELHGGEWRQLGMYGDLTMEPGSEYVAQPLKEDRSFDSRDGEFRSDTARQFRSYRQKIGR